jgi:hypothetical protein
MFGELVAFRNMYSKLLSDGPRTRIILCASSAEVRVTLNEVRLLAFRPPSAVFVRMVANRKPGRSR